MKILTKTPTHLHFRVDVGKYFIPALALFAGVWSGFAVWELVQPSQMQLHCQKTLAASDCQVTVWNAFNLQAQTQNIQLYGVRLEEHRRQAPTIWLDSSQGKIESTHDDEASRVEREIHDFLTGPTPKTLDAKLVLSWRAYSAFIISFAMGLASWIMLFRAPLKTDWRLELTASGKYHDHDQLNFSGEIYGTVRGIGWSRYIHRELNDVSGINTKILQGKGIQNQSYRIILKMRSGEVLELVPWGLNAQEWEEITQAISEILQISPPELPWKN
jgi:hypothetical protein